MLIKKFPVINQLRFKDPQRLNRARPAGHKLRVDYGCVRTLLQVVPAIPSPDSPFFCGRWSPEYIAQAQSLMI